MNSFKFFKYHGTGNDFIMIEDRDAKFPDNQQLIEEFCNRRFGIGADGLILLRSHPELDFEMVYFNSDGRQSSMCGNGGRCIAAFAKDRGWLNKEECSFIAIDGIHEAKIENNLIRLKMKDVDEIQKINGDYFTDTGSPHYIKFVDTVAIDGFEEQAKSIRYSEPYKTRGVNVNFVSVLDKGSLSMRTYERGVEAETWSCGTGMVAAAICAGLKDESTHFDIQSKGGATNVEFKKSGDAFSEIWLIGPAEFVYQGQLEI